mmetsp:Transcript_19222/g.28795  ORF Transcript_19222/g.28795 Transcript_19222/m.28795 type:complete len:291 (-) Transcript_19222:94-966(-)
MQPLSSTIKSTLGIRLITHIIVSCTILHLTHKNIFQNRLNRDAIEMERWDPSDIILHVFPITDLYSHVQTTSLIVTIVSIVLNFYEKYSMTPSQSSFSLLLVATRNYIFMIFVLFFLVSLVMILFGASPNMNLPHTLLASFHFTILTFGYFHLPMSSSTEKSSFDQILIYLLTGGMDTQNITHTYHKIGGSVSDKDGSNTNITQQHSEHNATTCTEISIGDEISRHTMYVTIFVTVPFQILNILDHGMQIQRWPLPILLGCTIGHCLGSIIGPVVAWSSYYLKNVEKKAQ